MASVKRTGAGKRPWVVRWRDPSGQQRKQSFVRKLDADRRATEVDHSLNVGQYIDQTAGREVFRSFAERWRLAQPVATNTRQRHRRELARHAYPAIGGRPLASIRTSELQAMVSGWELSPASVKVVWGTVRAVIRAAVRDRVIGFDPCPGVRLPDGHGEDAGEVWPLTTEQVELLATSITPRFRGLVVAAAGLGCRQGEGFGLQVGDVDFLRRREVRLVRQVQLREGGGTELVPLKTRGSRRTIPAGSSVLAELTAHLAEYRHPGSDLLFTDGKGRALHRTRFGEDHWWPAREAAAEVFRKRAADEADPDRQAELVRRADQLASAGMHDLRHFYASALIRHGLDVRTVAARMGHSNPMITLTVYSHLWPDAEDRSRQAIDAAFGYDPGADVPQVRPADGSRSTNAQVRRVMGGDATTGP